MILAQEVAGDIALQWQGVVALRGKIQRSTLFAFAQGAAVGVLTDAAYNLPFMHAFAVLNDALEAFAEGSSLPYRGRELGRLLAATREVLPWTDFDLVSEGQKARNAIAHRGDLLPRGECWKFIDAIQAELTGWGVITVPSVDGLDSS